MNDTTIRTPGIFGGLLAATVGAAVRGRLAVVVAEGRRRARSEHRPPAWKRRPATPHDQIGRLPETPPPHLGTPTLSAFHRLSGAAR